MSEENWVNEDQFSLMLKTLSQDFEKLGMRIVVTVYIDTCGTPQFRICGDRTEGLKLIGTLRLVEDYIIETGVNKPSTVYDTFKGTNH